MANGDVGWDATKNESTTSARVSRHTFRRELAGWRKTGLAKTLEADFAVPGLDGDGGIRGRDKR